MKRILLFSVLLAHLGFSQGLILRKSMLFARVPGPGGEGAGSGGSASVPTLVAGCQGVMQGAGGATTNPVNCTGAVGYIAATTTYAQNACTSGLIADSNSDTWHQLANYADGSFEVCLQYSCGITGTTGFTVRYPPTVAGVAFAGFTNLAGLCADAGQVNGSTGTSPLNTGSITPGASGELLAIALSSDTATANAMSVTGTCGLTWTVTNFLPVANGVGLSTGLAYAIQSAAGTCNPQVTAAGSGNNAVSVAAFKHL
jgi:hypothetical protein